MPGILFKNWENFEFALKSNCQDLEFYTLNILYNPKLLVGIVTR